MPHIRAHLDLPTLDALEDQWRLHPPVHLLVAGFLGYEAPPALDEGDAGEDASAAGLAPWLGAAGSIPASQALREAATQEDALAALERQFFGEVTDAPKL